MADEDKDSQKKEGQDSRKEMLGREEFFASRPFGLRAVRDPDGRRRYYTHDGREISAIEYEHRGEYISARSEFLRQRDAKLKPKSFSEKALVGLQILFFIALVVGAVRIVAVYGRDHGVNKEEIQSKIRTIVSNGGELGTVKHIYENRERYKVPLSDFLKKLPETYDYETPLSTILNDIKAEIYIQKNPGDTKTILAPLDRIISDHNTSNPFDKLDVAQKDLFLNIQSKIPNEYSSIENDTNKIADELHNKNLLVQEYLANSKTSLRVSWGALFIALLIGGTQIYLSLKRQRETIKHLIEATRFETNNNNTGENAATASDAEEVPETDGTTEPDKPG